MDQLTYQTEAAYVALLEKSLEKSTRYWHVIRQSALYLTLKSFSDHQNYHIYLQKYTDFFLFLFLSLTIFLNG